MTTNSNSSNTKSKEVADYEKLTVNVVNAEVDFFKLTEWEPGLKFAIPEVMTSELSNYWFIKEKKNWVRLKEPDKLAKGGTYRLIDVKYFVGENREIPITLFTEFKIVNRVVDTYQGKDYPTFICEVIKVKQPDSAEDCWWDEETAQRLMKAQEDGIQVFKEVK